MSDNEELDTMENAEDDFDSDPFLDEEDLQIIDNVKEALSQSSSWNRNGYLEIHDNSWEPLDIRLKEIPSESGMYAIGLAQGLCYDNAISRIVYLGSASNLRTRLSRHRTKAHNHVIELLMQHYREDLRFAWWTIPGFDRDFLYGIEAEALELFETTFGTLPLANLSVPEFIAGQAYCQGLVKVSPCKLNDPLTLEVLAERLDRVLVREEYISRNCLHLEVSLESGRLSAPNPNYRSIALLTRREAELPQYSGTNEDDDGQFDDDFDEEEYRLSFIHDENVAVWSENKMREVIKLCKQLEPMTSKAKIMKPYKAPFREVPVPHTWGEVALIQARIVGGSWQPGKQIWIRVKFGKEILGDGKLNDGWYYGEDESDLPQQPSERPRCKDFEVERETDRPLERVEETVKETYGLRISTVTYSRGSTFEDWQRKQAEAKAALWNKVEELFHHAYEGESS